MDNTNYEIIKDPNGREFIQNYLDKELGFDQSILNDIYSKYSPPITKDIYMTDKNYDLIDILLDGAISTFDIVYRVRHVKEQLIKAKYKFDKSEYDYILQSCMVYGFKKYDIKNVKMGIIDDIFKITSHKTSNIDPNVNLINGQRDFLIEMNILKKYDANYVHGEEYVCTWADLGRILNEASFVDLKRKHLAIFIYDKICDIISISQLIKPL